MDALRIWDNEYSCLIEDAIFFEDNSFSKISGNWKDGFKVDPPKPTSAIKSEGWSSLYPLLEGRSTFHIAIAGEASWGGTGFVALKKSDQPGFIWLIHLSTMNNPVEVKIKNELVYLKSDLNYPDGVTFVIPINQPELFYASHLPQ